MLFDVLPEEIAPDITQESIGPFIDHARFLVSPDSFEVYLEARALADKYEVPAGWQILYDRAWETALNQPIAVHLRAAPPQQPAAPAQPKPPPKVPD